MNHAAFGDMVGISYPLILVQGVFPKRSQLITGQRDGWVQKKSIY